MSLRLRIVRRLPGRFVGPLVLDRLVKAAVDAFETEPPHRPGRPFAERLAAFAESTAAEAAHGAGDAEPALYRNARALGATARRRLGITRPEEALQALAFLYRHIGIDIAGEPGGGGGVKRARDGAGPARSVDLEVTRCFFAAYYPESACRAMSAMDAGVVDGLFDGATLEFSQRITAGSPRCRAVITCREART